MISKNHVYSLLIVNTFENFVKFQGKYVKKASHFQGRSQDIFWDGGRVVKPWSPLATGLLISSVSQRVGAPKEDIFQRNIHIFII